MRILIDSFQTFVTLVATFALGVASAILTAHYLGPEGKGVFTLVFLLPALCASFGNLGLGAANVYFTRRGEAGAGVLIANSAGLALIVGIVASVCVFLFWPWLRATVLPGISPLLAALGLLTLPFALLTDYLLSMLLGSQKVARYNAASLTAKVFSVGAMAVALVVLGAGILGAVIASMLGTLAAFGLVGRELWRLHGGRLRIPRPDLGALKRSLSYGMREHIGNIAMFLSYRVDMFFVAALAGVSAVGIYAIAVMMAEMFFHLPNSVATVLFPHLAGSGRREGASNAARSARMVSFLVLLGALISIPLAAPAVRVAFSDRFLPAVPAFLALLPGVCALSVSKVLTRYFTGTVGDPLINARAHGLSIAVNLPLNVLLIPAYGIVGASIATSAAYIVHAVAMLVLFRRHSGLPVTSALLPRGEDFAWVSARVRIPVFEPLLQLLAFNVLSRRGLKLRTPGPNA
jgi:O-antigen/teichoic acid export membrane protein